MNFREDLFPVDPSQQETYNQRVREGYRKMSKQNIVICGLTRDVADVLPQTIQRIEQLGSFFESYKAVIFENDSQDDTLSLLEDWQARNNKVIIQAESRGDPVNPGIRCLDRATRMAYYRNQLRVRVTRACPEGWANNVIAVDTDLPGGWSYDGVANTFGHPQADWDFVGSNSILFRNYKGEKNKPVYFDVWAFRWRGSDTPTRPEDINPLHWPRGAAMVPINSCFGGLGVYRMDAFRRCSYDGTDCEHVPFHRKMRQSGMGRLFMNPSQITLYTEKAECSTSTLTSESRPASTNTC